MYQKAAITLHGFIGDCRNPVQTWAGKDMGNTIGDGVYTLGMSVDRLKNENAWGNF